MINELFFIKINKVTTENSEISYRFLKVEASCPYKKEN